MMMFFMNIIISRCHSVWQYAMAEFGIASNFLKIAKVSSREKEIDNESWFFFKITHLFPLHFHLPWKL